MEIQIRSHSALPELLSADPGRWDVLLVTNPDKGESLPKPCLDVLTFAKGVLRLTFHDYDMVTPGVVLPSPEDVQQALEWAGKR